MKEIVICSGEVNRYGYRNIPSGGRLEAYLACPVLLWNHEGHKLSVGKATNLRINEEGKLVCTPEFDEGDELAMNLKRKYEKGYMSALSMDHTPITVSEATEDLLPGQSRVTVKEWELNEISCCNVPGDRGAVTLNGGQVDIDKFIPKLQLNNQSQNQNIPNMEKISKALGLPVGSTEDAIVEGITSLQNKLSATEKARVDSLVQIGKDAGVITGENEEPIRKLAALDYENAQKLVQHQIKQIGVEEGKPGDTQLSLKSAIDAVKNQNTTTTPDKEEETFEKLSKSNPAKLNEIRQKEPERYAKLAAEYASSKA